jgi:uncharacterized protein with von Willebrand factor type A (vWA) domain
MADYFKDILQALLGATNRMKKLVVTNENGLQTVTISLQSESSTGEESRLENEMEQSGSGVQTRAQRKQESSTNIDINENQREASLNNEAYKPEIASHAPSENSTPEGSSNKTEVKNILATETLSILFVKLFWRACSEAD